MDSFFWNGNVISSFLLKHGLLLKELEHCKFMFNWKVYPFYTKPNVVSSFFTGAYFVFQVAFYQVYIVYRSENLWDTWCENSPYGIPCYSNLYCSRGTRDYKLYSSNKFQASFSRNRILVNIKKKG